MAKRTAAERRYTISSHQYPKPRNPQSSAIRTHRFLLPQHPQHQYRFQDKEHHQENQGDELVKHIEAEIPIRIRQAIVKPPCPPQRRIERDVTRADEEGDAGQEDGAEGEGGAVVEELVADDAVEEEHPYGGDYGA